MPLSPLNRIPLAAALVVSVVLAAIGIALRTPGWAMGDAFLHRSYDSLHAIAGANTAALSNSPVVIVYIDLASFQSRGLDTSQPWPRALHAQLLRRLATAGARAVVFDVVFGGPGPNTNADIELAAAIRTHGRVILATEYNYATSAPNGGRVWSRVGSLEKLFEPFAREVAGIGFASQGIDDDFVVRKYVAGFSYDSQPSITWATASAIGLPVVAGAGSIKAANDKWLRYYGPAMAIPHIGFDQALDPGGVTDEFFKGKIVFIGGRPFTGTVNERKDEFRNPFHSWQYRDYFMPGVEVHATEMLNLVRGDGLSRLAGWSELLILFGIATVYGFGLLWLRPIQATIAALVGAGVVLAATHMGFGRGIWFPWLVVAGGQIPVALGFSILWQSAGWYRARKAFEMAKRVADAKIREQAALIDKAHDAILVQDLGGRISYANPSAERLLGWPIRELQKPAICEEVFSPSVESAALARKSALRDGEWNGELSLRTNSDQLVIVSSRWTLIRDGSGRAASWLIINSDITDNKQLEAQFLRTQRMNTIGDLAGGMAHDLNNALAPILMGAQLLRRRAPDAESQRLLQMMESSTHRSAEMVRQVLLFARGREGEFERLSVRDVVRELESLVSETFPKSIDISVFLPDDLWLVRGNATQIHQVLLNLCVNARDAMPTGGKLTLLADNVYLGDAEAANIAEGRAGEFVSLVVSDTGSGISPLVIARIFEPFFSTKGEGKGTGIGLSTAVRIVKNHGGFLRMESQLGEGTSFEVFIPRAEEIHQQAVSEPEADLPRGRGETILLADDERVIRELAASELATFGYRVLTAVDGEDAVATFRLHPGEIQLFIGSIEMPNMGGAQAAVELRKLAPGLPVILVSGTTRIPDRENVAFVQKPFTLEELLSAIAAALRPQ